MSDLVTVFEAGDPALVALAKSVLESAGIEFAAKGEGVQDLFGFGRFPGGSNLVTGPVAFQVSAEDADRARSLLSELEQDEDDDEEDRPA